MKTVILYATKHGASAEIARRISEEIRNSIIHNLKQECMPPISEFDCVIVGSSVYAGAFRKEAKTFFAQNADILKEKRLGLFLSGMSGNDGAEVFSANVPEDVLKAAKARCALGGIFDPKKSNLFERLIMRVVTKKSEYVSTISDERISEFVDAMNDVVE